MGGNIVAQEAVEFANRINQVISSEQATETILLGTLKYNANLPGRMLQENRFQFLSQLQSMDWNVNNAVPVGPGEAGDILSGGGGGDDDSAPASDKDKDDDTDTLIDTLLDIDLWIPGIVFGVLLLVAVLVATWYLVRKCYKPKHSSKNQNHKHQKNTMSQVAPAPRSPDFPEDHRCPYPLAEPQQAPPTIMQQHYPPGPLLPANNKLQYAQNSQYLEECFEDEFRPPQEITFVAEDNNNTNDHDSDSLSKHQTKKHSKKQTKKSSEDEMISVDTTVAGITIDSSIHTTNTTTTTMTTTTTQQQQPLTARNTSFLMPPIRPNAPLSDWKSRK
ncbi:hypothetical protein ACA910_017300 [Epithemia clementina (nom. ined.)]